MRCLGEVLLVRILLELELVQLFAQLHHLVFGVFVKESVVILFFRRTKSPRLVAEVVVGLRPRTRHVVVRVVELRTVHLAGISAKVVREVGVSVLL